MTTPLRNVFVCCAAPRRNLDDELLVSTTPVSPLAHRKRRGYTPKNNAAVNQTHGTVWSSRRASYAHSAKTSSQHRVMTAGVVERHHSMDVGQTLLLAQANAPLSRTSKCDTPSTAAPDSPKEPSVSENSPSNRSRYKDADTFHVPPPPPTVELRPLSLKPKKSKKKADVPSYEVSNQTLVNDASFVSYASPLMTTTAESYPNQTPQIIRPSPSEPSMALKPAPLHTSTLVPLKSLLSKGATSSTTPSIVPITAAAVVEKQAKTPQTPAPQHCAAPLSTEPSMPVSPLPARPTEQPASPVVVSVDVAKSANFACPHNLSISRRRLRPVAEHPDAKYLAPPTAFEFADTSLYKHIHEEVTYSTRPEKMELLEMIKSMGNTLVLRGLQVEEVWITGRKFPKRKVHLFLSKDLTNFWWDSDIRHCCELVNVTGTFSWRQMLRLSRLHPFLMSESMRELGDEERRRLVAFEAVNHNGYLTRHWFACSSAKVADDFATCMGMFKP